MIENQCGYSDDWQPYNGDYDKFEYDIRLKDGREVCSCFPNGDTFLSLSDEFNGQYFDAREVAEIRFSQTRKVFMDNPYTSSVFPEYKRKLEEDVLPLLKEFPFIQDFYKPRIPKGIEVSVRTGEKKTRNAVCDCGSGRKYKKCCQPNEKY